MQRYLRHRYQLTYISGNQRNIDTVCYISRYSSPPSCLKSPKFSECFFHPYIYATFRRHKRAAFCRQIAYRICPHDRKYRKQYQCHSRTGFRNHLFYSKCSCAYETIEHKYNTRNFYIMLF